MDQNSEEIIRKLRLSLSQEERAERAQAHPDTEHLQRLDGRRSLLTALQRHPEKAEALFWASYTAALQAKDVAHFALSQELFFYSRLRKVIPQLAASGPKVKKQVTKSRAAKKPRATVDSRPTPPPLPPEALTEKSGTGPSADQGVAPLAHVANGEEISEREWQVAQLIVKGLSDAAICRQIENLQSYRFTEHLKSLIHKLGATSRKDLPAKLRSAFPELGDHPDFEKEPPRGPKPAEPSSLKITPRPFDASVLSSDHKHLIALLASDVDGKEIARLLGISVGNFYMRSSALYRILGVAGRSEVATVAERLGLSTELVDLPAAPPRQTEIASPPEKVSTPTARVPAVVPARISPPPPNGNGHHDGGGERILAAGVHRPITPAEIISRQPAIVEEEEDDEAPNYDVYLEPEELRIVRTVFLRRVLSIWRLAEGLKGINEARKFLNSGVEKVDRVLRSEGLVSVSPDLAEFLDQYKKAWSERSVASVIRELTPRGQPQEVKSIDLGSSPAPSAKPGQKEFKLTDNSYDLLNACLNNPDPSFDPALINRRCSFPPNASRNFLSEALRDLRLAQEAEGRGDSIEQATKALLGRIAARFGGGGSWEVDEIIALVKDNDGAKGRTGVPIAV